MDYGVGLVLELGTTLRGWVFWATFWRAGRYALNGGAELGGTVIAMGCVVIRYDLVGLLAKLKRLQCCTVANNSCLNGFLSSLPSYGRAAFSHMIFCPY